MGIDIPEKEEEEEELNVSTMHCNANGVFIGR